MSAQTISSPLPPLLTTFPLQTLSSTIVRVHLVVEQGSVDEHVL